MTTLCLPLRASLRSLGRRHCDRVVPQLHHTTRFLSSEANGGSPLLLWLSSDTPSNTTVPPRILMPKSHSTKVTVSSSQQVVEAVDQHYSLSSDSQQFVGGMGESDAGVWFACEEQDPLQHFPLIQESIRSVKEFRHGVPFGTFTSGVDLPSDLPLLGEIGLARVQVSLLAANPKDYAAATGLSDSDAIKAFGQVCGFCVNTAETGFPLEVSVLQPYASSARDLAVSLGAVDVHIYKE